MNAARRLVLISLAVLCVSAGGLLVSVQAFAAAPTVGEESFSGVGSASATLTAKASAEGVASTYHFEYGTSTAYGSGTREESLGSASEAVSVVVELSELHPGTPYHFRLVVTNAAHEVSDGSDMIFTTLPESSSVLPDGRVYEMVTPPRNQDAEAYVPGALVVHTESNGIYTTLPFQAAADGGAVAYPADPTSGGNGNDANGQGNEYLATRVGAGWEQLNVQPSGYGSTGYEAFSSDLSMGVLTSCSKEPLVAGAPGNFYLGLYTRSSIDGSYHSLFASPAHFNRSNPNEFRAAGLDGTGQCEAGGYAGSSTDLTHSLFEVNDVLTAGAVDGGLEENNLYDSVEGQVHLVNVLPDGNPAVNATFGAYNSVLEAYFPGDDADFSNVISGDGSRVFWTDLNKEVSTEDPSGATRLFVRENDTQPQSPLDSHGDCVVSSDACTVQVDAARGGSGVGGNGQFWTANSDGSRVLFTDSDTAGLTADTVSGSGVNLYEYDVNSGVLSDLTPGSDAGVLGVLGAGQNENDEGYVYFAAQGILADNENSNGQRAASGEANLYLLHNNGATRTIVFIATLAKEDGLYIPPYGFRGSGDDWTPSLGARTAEVTPDGHDVVFMSRSSLTGYPNAGMSEVFTYDASMGRLSCVSCSRSGEFPPIENEGNFGAAGFLPVSERQTYQHRWMSANGDRIFFDSPEPLVPQDTNGVQDVYEWERDGSGGCAQEEGCLYLLSGGTSTYWSWLLDASVSGDDVFVITRAQLLPVDQNEVYDLYDVRANGMLPVSGPVCSGTGCQGVPPASPIFSTPSSVTFNGVGNFNAPSKAPAKPVVKRLTRTQKLNAALKACKKQKGRRRSVCETQARRRYGAVSKAKKSLKGGK
jgi:hypothetical protein